MCNVVPRKEGNSKDKGDVLAKMRNTEGLSQSLKRSRWCRCLRRKGEIVGNQDASALKRFSKLDKLQVMYDATVYIGGVTWCELKYI